MRVKFLDCVTDEVEITDMALPSPEWKLDTVRFPLAADVASPTGTSAPQHQVALSLRATAMCVQRQSRIEGRRVRNIVLVGVAGPHCFAGFPLEHVRGESVLRNLISMCIYGIDFSVYAAHSHTLVLSPSACLALLE